VNKGIREKNGAFNMEHLQQYWVQKVSANESEATFNIKVKLVFF